MNFWCQNWRPWKAKTSISHYTYCNLRSRRTMEFDEKCSAKGNRTSFKIRAAGTQGVDFSDFGTVSIFHFTFCRISPSLCAHQDPPRTHPGPSGENSHTLDRQKGRRISRYQLYIQRFFLWRQIYIDTKHVFRIIIYVYMYLYIYIYIHLFIYMYLLYTKMY